MATVTITFTVPDAEAAHYGTAITAELDPAGTSGLTAAQLAKRYVLAALKDVVARYDRKQAEIAARNAMPAEIALT